MIVFFSVFWCLCVVSSPPFFYPFCILRRTLLFRVCPLPCLLCECACFCFCLLFSLLLCMCVHLLVLVLCAFSCLFWYCACVLSPACSGTVRVSWHRLFLRLGAVTVLLCLGVCALPTAHFHKVGGVSCVLTCFWYG